MTHPEQQVAGPPPIKQFNPNEPKTKSYPQYYQPNEVLKEASCIVDLLKCTGWILIVIGGLVLLIGTGMTFQSSAERTIITDLVLFTIGVPWLVGGLMCFFCAIVVKLLCIRITFD